MEAPDRAAVLGDGARYGHIGEMAPDMVIWSSYGHQVQSGLLTVRRRALLALLGLIPDDAGHQTRGQQADDAGPQ